MLSSTVIRYLLVIHELSPDNAPLPSVAIARRLNVTRSSVAKNLFLLTQQALVEKAHYGKARLTPSGLRMALQYEREYRAFCQLFLRLGLSAEEGNTQALAVVSSLSPRGKNALLSLHPGNLPLASGD